MIFGGNDIVDFREGPIPGRSRIIQRQRLFKQILKLSLLCFNSNINYNLMYRQLAEFLEENFFLRSVIFLFHSKPGKLERNFLV